MWDDHEIPILIWLSSQRDASRMISKFMIFDLKKDDFILKDGKLGDHTCRLWVSAPDMRNFVLFHMFSDLVITHILMVLALSLEVLCSGLNEAPSGPPTLLLGKPLTSVSFRPMCWHPVCSSWHSTSCLRVMLLVSVNTVSPRIDDSSEHLRPKGI